MVVRVPSGEDQRLADHVVRLVGDLTAAVARERDPLTVAHRPDPDGTHAVVVPALDDLLHRVRDLWWQRLDPADRLAVHVAAMHRDSRPTPLGEVITACRLASGCGQPVTVPEFTSMTCGSVKPGPRGTWQAEVGTRPYGIGHIGEYGSIRAANAAVWDTIETNRELLRERLRTTSPLLAGVASRGWEEPDVSVWASAEQRDSDDTALVTMHQIAHRTRVRPAEADRWRAAHAAFPPPEPGTSVWYWPLVERWLADNGHLPDPIPDDRPTLPRDKTF
ncbi:hypothetical protein FB565_000900 [Actinoplanes lutulentus]|uniref:Uncharacterized protein n=1 Tax=Actinoplanes lutulentus TaxID=1287878 RepID=A0A327ZM16_9ACTN|nr:hypothetical protein [Actinoplanes lutulentus]MBB2941196.1 hypothetical protein [Actinoplanes lutulentus]RAK43505.1 hypothetical protein B0I29_101635 [Actinoplanes lutulentus]